MSYEKLFKSEISDESVKAWKAQGKKAVGVICCHVPLEIFYALDVMPVRIRATGVAESPDGDAWMSTFTCSYARGMLQHIIDGTYDALDGVVASDGCMMASRAYDNAEHINKKGKKGKLYFQFGAPRKSGDLEHDFFVGELKDLIEKLEQLSGNKMTDEKLKAAIDKYNEARSLIQQVYALRKEDKPVISGEDCLKLTMAIADNNIDEYIAMVKEFLADVKNRKPVEGKQVRVMVIGSALDDPEYIKIIEDQGALVVADALCYGSRSFNYLCEIKGNDILGSLADYYLDRIVCPRMIDNRDRLHDWIMEQLKAYKCDGVIYEKMQYCELWGGEGIMMEDMLKKAGIPILTVEREEHIANAGQLAIRAEAFVEMIESK